MLIDIFFYNVIFFDVKGRLFVSWFDKWWFVCCRSVVDFIYIFYFFVCYMFGEGVVMIYFVEVRVFCGIVRCEEIIDIIYKVGWVGFCLFFFFDCNFFNFMFCLFFCSV